MKCLIMMSLEEQFSWKNRVKRKGTKTFNNQRLGELEKKKHNENGAKKGDACSSWCVAKI